MNKYGFWILLGGCIAAAGLVYALEVGASVKQIEGRAEVLELEAARAEAMSEEAIGAKMIQSMEDRQAEVAAGISKLRERFASRDASQLDRWFPELETPWSNDPLRPDFKRQYALGLDRISREVSGLLAANGLRNAQLHLIEYPWIQGEEEPLAAEMRHLQREFWVQERVVRSIARFGAVLTRPIRGGESENNVGRSGAGEIFDRLRYDVQVRCPSNRVLEVIHAFDGDFVVTLEDGSTETMGLTASVDNLSVRRINVNSSVANIHPVEPPVDVNFFLTILDFKQGKGAKAN